MKLFKTDFSRFFTIGFVAGALLVFGTMEGQSANELANGFVPAAEAAPAE